ncbi:MAG TPA: formate dehydrogenase, partial [Ktedonobacter sp.]|nr:formate dehydrogenase [Ktedonobacter sp.]
AHPNEIQHDETMQDPRCVLQILKRHFSRYTPEMVEKVTGVPPDMFHKIADTLVKNSGRERTTSFCYAVGWTQHTIGVQIIRTAGILQLLLGNMGRPGGGIMALRGHANIQGSTDIPTLYNLLPGYLTMPSALREEFDYETYMDHNAQ